MSTPLNEREKIWATALGLANIMRNPRSKEQGDQIWQGLEILGRMMTDELEQELRDLAARNADELKGVIKEMLTGQKKDKKTNWPTLDADKPKQEAKPDDYDPEDPYRTFSA